jgi:hypothetical protein
MSIISNENKIQIKALTTGGLKPAAIAKQLKLKYETVKKHVYRQKLVADLPPKVIVQKGYFTGRVPGIIRRYIEDYPLARLDDIMAACELTCHKTTLARYLNNNGLGGSRQSAIFYYGLSIEPNNTFLHSNVASDRRGA